MSPNEPTLTVVTTTQSKMRGPEDQVRKLVEKGIPLDKLQQSFARFLGSLQQVFSDIEQGRVGNFELDEIAFSVEIGADGEFKLVGAGVGISSTSSVTFTLHRRKSEEERSSLQNDQSGKTVATGAALNDT